MFEYRSKSKYDFKKFDNEARTKVQVLEKVKEKSDAHKKLFGAPEKKSKDVLTQKVKEEVINPKYNPNIEELPSSQYLKQFENQIVEVQEDTAQDNAIEQGSEMDFISLLDTAKDVEIDTKRINKELENVVAKPKKNYSFRIKLITGVYCILVALFGGWVISNTINISQTNSYLYEATARTTEINNNILDIIGDIEKLDSVSSDPEDDTIVVKIVTEEIQITPEAIREPNDYQKSSNGFDTFCNWISSIFGG